MYLSSHQAWVSERSPILSITISFIPQKYLYLPTEDNNTMENSHKYFKRDISWLSFNYRVLLEAEDETLPIYERIKFLSIYSSNLEEFYEIRVAEHRE